MKTKAEIFALLLLLFFAFNYISYSQPQYYNYQNVGTSSNVFPFGVVEGKRMQYIFLANDFTQPAPAPGGNITKIYFYMTATASTFLTGFTVKMGQTSLTQLPASAWYTGELKTVYNRPSVQLTSAQSNWMMIELDSAFLYDPAQSLVMDIVQCSATNTDMTLRQNTLTGLRRSYSPFAQSCPHSWDAQNNQVLNLGVDISPPVGISGNTNVIPDDYKLVQNYPNPFNPVTTINFQLPEAAYTSLKVYNVLGIEVASLVESNITAGVYNINFDASHLASGVYYYTLTAGEFRDTKKMLLVK